jgi:hypothetical protein
MNKQGLPTRLRKAADLITAFYRLSRGASAGLQLYFASWVRRITVISITV